MFLDSMIHKIKPVISFLQILLLFAMYYFVNFFCNLQLALPSETTMGTCFLQNYIESILALQDASCRLVQGLSLLKAYHYLIC